MVFSDNLFNKDPRTSNPTKGIKGSFLDSITPEVVVCRRVDLESSLCFSLLKDFLLNPLYSERPHLKTHKFKVSNPIFQSELGGWMKLKDENQLVELTRNKDHSATDVFVELTEEKINDLRYKNVRGDTPQNPVGYDLMPSSNTRPSPLVTSKRVVPIDMDASIKLVEFANATNGKYTSEYVKSAPPVRLIRGMDPQILIMKSLKPRIHLLNISWI